MKILRTEAQLQTKSLFNALHPTTKSNTKVDETPVKNPAAGKKNRRPKKTQNYSETRLGNRIVKPVPSTLLTH